MVVVLRLLAKRLPEIRKSIPERHSRQIPEKFIISFQFKLAQSTLLVVVCRMNN